MINILTKLKWNNRLTQPACVTCHVARAVINIVAVATLGMGELGGRGGGWGGTMNRCYDCHSQNCHPLTLSRLSLGETYKRKFSVQKMTI